MTIEVGRHGNGLPGDRVSPALVEAVGIRPRRCVRTYNLGLAGGLLGVVRAPVGYRPSGRGIRGTVRRKLGRSMNSSSLYMRPSGCDEVSRCQPSRGLQFPAVSTGSTGTVGKPRAAEHRRAESALREYRCRVRCAADVVDYMPANGRGRSKRSANVGSDFDTLAGVAPGGAWRSDRAVVEGVGAGLSRHEGGPKNPFRTQGRVASLSQHVRRGIWVERTAVVNTWTGAQASRGWHPTFGRAVIVWQ